MHSQTLHHFILPLNTVAVTEIPRTGNLCLSGSKVFCPSAGKSRIQTRHVNFCVNCSVQRQNKIFCVTAVFWDKIKTQTVFFVISTNS